MHTTSLKTLFEYKAWANDELFAALASFPEQHPNELHFCIRVLNHIFVVDRIFRAHLSDEAHPYDSTGTKETPTLAQLRRDVAETDAWYVRYLSTITADTLSEIVAFTFTDGDKGSMSREEILLHVATHGAYHRGNVGQVFRVLDVPGPRDLYTKFLHQSDPSRREA